MASVSKSAWLIMVYFALAAVALGDDWPQWRGPNRDGKSLETGLLKQWPASGPQRLWSIEGLGEGYGSVAVKGDRIYVQGSKGKESIAFCLDRIEGKQIWARPLGERLIQDKGNGDRGTPTVADGAVYVLTGVGDLACLDEKDGKVIWQRNILKDFGGQNIHWGISESPLIDGDKLIVNPGGREAAIVALDKKTGKTIWASRELSDGASYSSCIPMEIGSIRAITTFTSAAAVGVRASDGKLLWHYAKPANGTANVATPVFDGTKVFYTTAYGTGGGLLDLTLNGDKIEAREVYFSQEMQNHHGGVVLVDGYIYGFSNAILTCMKFDTGEVAWKDRSVGKGSLCYADGNLYVLGENYTMGLVEATPAKYREHGRFKLEDRGQNSWAHPVISNGRLYVRNWDTLSSYNVAALVNR